MTSPTLRKSVTDLTRRPARTVLTVITLAFAVASMSFFAIPTLIDRAMQQEVRDGRLADVTVAMRPLELTEAQLASLRALPNVRAVEPRASLDVRALIGDRRAPAVVIGVRDFADQSVDMVRIESGSFPGPGEVLADVQDANVGVYDGGAGDALTVLGEGGEPISLDVAGRGRSLPGGERVQDDSVIVLYAPLAAISALGGDPGYSQLAFLLEDPSAAAAQTTVDAVRHHLDDIEGFGGFLNLPGIRTPGDWPAKSDTEQFAKLLGVITALALASAVVLIANTMSTLIGEQTREVAVMRAIGARRRQVLLVYLRTSLLLGALGAVLGSALGVALSSVLASMFGWQFWAVRVDAGIDAPVLAVSVLVGLITPPLAALPAIRRGLRVDLREALEASGSTLGGQGATDRLFQRAGFVPSVMLIGLRNVGRRARRSVATTLIVALAVANLLAVLALSASATETTRREWGDHLEDVQIFTSGAALFDQHAEDVILSTPGVVEAEPVLKNQVRLGGTEASVWGVVHEPLLRYRLAEGRWFSVDELEGASRVAVVERNIAQIEGVRLGDTVSLRTAAGDADFEVVGIAKNQQENGTALFVPLTTARSLLGQPTSASTYWVSMTAADDAFVDRTTTLLEDRLAALGYEVASEITYVATRDEVAANRSLTSAIAALGFVIVAISMVGLANAMTTNVLERTREIGVLRSIGARGRDLRRMFTTEGLTLALAGWFVGIPLGYGLARLLVWLVWQVVDVRLPVVFPLGNLAIALVGTIALALVVLHLPVRRAARFRPGDALRYA